MLHGRLLTFVLTRVNNGDFTERGLARVLNISQPQMHNVLKGNRKLTPALADRIMQRFGLSVVDLLHEHEIKASPNGSFDRSQITGEDSGEQWNRETRESSLRDD